MECPKFWEVGTTAMKRLKELFICVFLSVAVKGIAQSSNDWPMYGHDGGSSRYSPLTDVNTQNVANLKRAWTFHMAPASPASPTPATGLAARLRQRRTETTPLMVDGVLFLPTPYNQVIALDASSGKEIWEYKIPNDGHPNDLGNRLMARYIVTKGVEAGFL